MNTFEIVLSEERKASMTMYLNLESPELHCPARPLMVVLPGGGYGMCSDRESEIVALQYLAAGYQACILRYTLKDKGGWPWPLNDYDEAMERIAQHAEEWRIDMSRTAVVGFSAGGHLAACAATLAKHKPRAAILVYAAILKDITDACQSGMPYPFERVDGDTSPCYIAAGRDDSLVSVNNSMAFAQALEKAGVTFDLHIYSSGQHGFSIATPLILNGPATPRLAHWVPDSIGWLGELMGTLTDSGYTEPTLSAKLNADLEPVLSVKCTLSHIRRQEKALPLLEPLLQGIRANAAERGVEIESFFSAIGSFTVKELLEMLQFAPEQIWKLNEALNQIPNEEGTL